MPRLLVPPATRFDPPDGFIPLPKVAGLINPLGEWVSRKACTDAMNWPPHIKVVVNLSPAQFPRAGEALTASGFPPERLELEITEWILMQSNIENLKMLHQFQGLGFSIVLDGFGTGYFLSAICGCFHSIASKLIDRS